MNFIHPTAEVESGARIGENTYVWQNAHIRSGATVDDNCVIARGVYIGGGVNIGSNVKIQNYALIYEPATVADGVFIGPSVVFTNDLRPRAITPEGLLKKATDWEMAAVQVFEGASIGANSVCVAPLRIGKWAMIGSGSTVVRDVPDFALVVGNPARQIGWVGKFGEKLEKINDYQFKCPKSGEKYSLISGRLEEFRD